MKKVASFLIILLLGFSFKAKADEGMWLLPLIEKLNLGTMTELGLKLSAEDIYSLNKASLKDAVVIFGGGCTAEIVSSEGLLLTNHHCGYDLIQTHSSLDHDYLRDGFWAMSREEELVNPGLRVTFLLNITDVTDQVLANVTPEMNESDRSAKINEARTAIEQKASEGNNYRASVSSFYGGNYFYLLVYEIYSDVRLVGAPPSSIGKYGDDTDNWEWPRHTGDFSVFRVYSGPDGKPAPYSEDNVPLKPKYWLPVSLKDLNTNDFAMILGYPGGTQRYYTSYEVKEIMDITNPNRVKIRGVKQEIWLADMLADQKVDIQYATKYSRSSNYWKYSIGQNNQLRNLNVIAKKELTEEKFNKWVNANEQRKEKYGDALNLIKSAIEGRAEYQNALQYLNECIQGCEILSLTRQLDDERLTESPDELKQIYSEIYKDYNPPTDLKSTKAMLKLYREDMPAKFLPDFYTEVVDKKFKGDIDKFVDKMFAKSIFASEEKLFAFIDNPNIKILEKDPAVTTFASIVEVARSVSQELGKFSPDLQKGQRLWVAAMLEMQTDKIHYPDANFTMRLTYGTIQNYDPRDAVTYKHFTSLKGVIEKYKPGDYEFDLPQRLIDLYNNKEYGRYASSKGYMPVCFLTTNDITGGNSGSPVLNGNGELIGLAFDGNWEAMSGDVAYEPEIQRTIAVDIRYVLWIMDVYAGAGHLVKEMTIRE